MFEPLLKVLSNAQKLSTRKAWNTVMTERRMKELIISLNTNEQLGEEGIDANDKSLGEYAPLTIQFRRSKGLQVDHIDFKVTGDYWASWRVEVSANELKIKVDEKRFYELTSLLRFSKDHVGLTDENILRLQNYIRTKYVEYIREQILLRG